jgi:hypothetical protein
MQISSQPLLGVSALFGKVIEKAITCAISIDSLPGPHEHHPVDKEQARLLLIGNIFVHSDIDWPSSEFHLADLTSVSYRLSAPLNNSSRDTSSFTANAVRINTVGL